MCNTCNSSGYLRLTSRIYLIGLLLTKLDSLIELTSKLSTVSSHLNPP